MYGKIFDSIYDGTLVEDWRALVTFQQMIVLCDADGTIDMTPSAISRRTGIPIEHIKAGIEILENPDPYSRTDEEKGRRITRLDDHRPWGWSIVNHTKYKNLKDADTVRAQNKERKRRQRQREAGMDDSIKHDCAYCGDEATGPDHIIPTSEGGTNTDDNVVPCCPRCNQHKASRSVQAFVTDPFVDWIDIKLIMANEKLCRHADVTQMSQESRHTDTNTDSDKIKDIGQVTLSDGFDKFWQAYPRKVKKKDALGVWKSKHLHKLADTITADVLNRIANDGQWLDGFEPHATTYLRGERWEDEIEKPRASNKRGGTPTFDEQLAALDADIEQASQ